MTYLDELKEFSRLHIRSQRDARALEQTLAAIDDAASDGPGGWTREWSAHAERYTREGRDLEAIQCLNFARFPFVDSPARAAAHRACVDRFSTWASARDARVKRVAITALGQRVPIYVRVDDPGRPVLIAIGGIVSVKEQWHRLLFGAARLGFSAVLAECPGVGENPLLYRPGCHRFLGAILDQLSRETGTCEAYVVGLSFGGSLAIRQALEDSRIHGITTVGPPLSDFYTDAAWWRGVPAVTKRTLSHVCRVGEHELPALLPQFAFTAAELQSLRIPVHCVCSTRDEIVPPSERRFIEDNVGRLDLVTFDDVHGAVNHLSELQKYIPWSVLAQRGAPMSPLRMLVTLNLAAATLARVVTTRIRRGAGSR
jgi:esterase FrsA